MQILVVGAGIIGSVYGWALAESGHRVVHLVRPGRATALLEGVPVDILDRRKGHTRNFRGHYRLQALETLSPTDTFELVVVPVKHYVLAETLDKLVPRVGSAEFLLLTQNWQSTGEIDPVLPRERYVYGDAKAGGSFAGGTLIAAVKALDVGSAEGAPSTLAKKAAALFASADIQTRLHADMLHYLWVQYAITGSLWAALVQAGSFEALLSDRNATSAALRAVGECLQVVRRRGVDLSLYPEAKPFLTNSALRRRVEMWMARWMFRHDEYTKRCSAHAFGDPIEVEKFYDDLTTTGHELSVSMPEMESYCQAVRSFAARSVASPS